MEISKIKLLRVLEIMKQTDEDHPIPVNQIIKKLKLYGIEAERKSVLRDIYALRDCGYDIVLHSDNKRGFFMGSREFEDWELKVLMDAVASSEFLTEKNRKDMINKISALASVNSQKVLKAVTPLLSSEHTGDPVTKNNIDIILKAISKQSKIGFEYTYTGTDLKKHLRYDGMEYSVSPYTIVRKQDRYYLIANYDKYDTLSYFRLERISDPEILEEKALPPEKLLGNGAKTRIADFVERNIYNFSGETTFIRLTCDEDRIDLLVDTFGTTFHIEKVENGKVTAGVTINDGWGITSWLVQHGDVVEVLEPKSVRNDVIDLLKRLSLKYEIVKGENK
ncbi:MAG: WYL domain-containing protein [Clostridia bacterium]|nr:WYL domain-containing protein [Clostridia bacterium]